jgi:hypothetical protein
MVGRTILAFLELYKMDATMATTNDNLEIQKQDRVVVVVLGRLEGLPSCLMDAFRSYFRSDTMDRLFLQRKLLRGDE